MIIRGEIHNFVSITDFLNHLYGRFRYTKAIPELYQFSLNVGPKGV